MQSQEMLWGSVTNKAVLRLQSTKPHAEGIKRGANRGPQGSPREGHNEGERGPVAPVGKKKNAQGIKF